MVLGKAVRRVEDGPLLDGRGCWTDDIVLPDQLYVSFVRSNEAHARLAGVDVEAARLMPDVVGVWTGQELEPLPGVPTCGGYMTLAGLEQPVLARERVRYVGEPVAVVVARSRAAAADAVEAVVIDYEPLPAVVDPMVALDPAAPTLFPDLGTNVILDENPEPIPDGFFSEADIVVEISNLNHRMASVAMEPRAALAGRHPDTGELTLWLSSQHPQKVRNDIMAILGFGADQLRVIAPEVGGGFGPKAMLHPEEVVLVMLARRLGRPVKWSETRSEHLVATHHGRAQIHRWRVGAKRDGTLVAIAGDVIADVGAYPSLAPLLVSVTAQMAPGCYRVQRVHLRARAVLTNTTPVGPYRGAGRPEAAFTIERAVEEVARRLHLDPIDVRRRNFIQPAEFPYETATEMSYDSGDYEACLDRLLEGLDIDQVRKEQADRVAQGRPLLGVGIACYVEISGSLGLGEEAAVEVLPDGRVEVRTGTSPHGQGHRTVWAQIAAHHLGVQVDAVDVVHGDTRYVAQGNGTTGSRSAQFGGSAVYRASELMAQRLRELAADLLEAAPADIELAEGGAYVRGTPSRRLSLAELRSVAGDEGLRESFFFDQDNWTYPGGAHGVVVEIDRDTGLVRPVRVVAVDDCGTLINPLIVEGQVHGGVVQGLAQALWEEVRYSAEGQPLTTSLLDYLVPSACEVPSLETYAVETPSPLNPLGAKGIGEAGAVGMPPAVVNAVLDALAPLGVRDIPMPLTPERVWRAIADAENEQAGRQ
ncbi:MAG: xanthine dehydrogenase family protein molybdopterin-binding subunit [Actinomycetota bacterium]|jgi:aerobic carbon-monoxide dehydrogenase large subunit